MNKFRLLHKYVFFDILSAILVWLLFVLYRKLVNSIPIGTGLELILTNPLYFVSITLFPLCSLFIHYLTGFYVNSLRKSKVNVFFTTMMAAIAISVGVFFVLMLNDVTVSFKYFYLSMLVLFALQFAINYTFRAMVYADMIHNFATKKWTINTLIIGTGEKALNIAAEIDKNSPRNTVVGYITTTKQSVVPQEKVLGKMTKIADVIEKYNVEETIIALENSTDEHQLFDIINSLFQYNLSIQFTPRLYEILSGSARMSKSGNIPLVSITNPSMTSWETCVKRLVDIFVSVFGLVFLSPFLLYFIIQIKRDSAGPIFYRQERIGRLGKPFKIIKFRTMKDKSENGTPQLSSENDERITKVGKVMRKYRIDEIPQFWNILKGDMSLVGPRPEREFYIHQIIEKAPYYCLLYKIRPGLTSWGPIKIGYSDSVEKMIERLNYDIIYMDNMSLVEDLKILTYTFEIIFRGKGV